MPRNIRREPFALKKNHSAQNEFMLPPEDDLSALLDATRSGDILEIRDQIARLEQDNTAYLPFTTKIRELAGRFQINHLRSLLETSLHESLQNTAPEGEET